eukprot:scaffold156445_cov20-Tisochrysis_lutea.AAC.2
MAASCLGKGGPAMGRPVLKASIPENVCGNAVAVRAGYGGGGEAADTAAYVMSTAQCEFHCFQHCGGAGDMCAQDMVKAVERRKVRHVMDTEPEIITAGSQID